jgi:hypothetical protein
MPYTKEEISGKAEEVHRRSLKYQLAHAALACEELLQVPLEREARLQTVELEQKRREAMRRGDKRLHQELTEESDRLKRARRHIYTQYISTLRPETAYVVTIMGEFVIFLSRQLAEQSVDEATGVYTERIVHLRRNMAHELGHAILHTQAVLDGGYTRGKSKYTSGEEREADWFADRLLELRGHRNKLMRRNGTHTFFE